MGKNFFSRIADLINGNQQNEMNNQESKDSSIHLNPQDATNAPPAPPLVSAEATPPVAPSSDEGDLAKETTAPVSSEVVVPISAPITPPMVESTECAPETIVTTATTSGNSANEPRSNSTDGTQHNSSPRGIQHTNSIDKREALLNAIIASLKANYSGSNINLTNRSLTLEIKDGIFYDALIAEKFYDELSVTISDELGLEFGKVDITIGSGSQRASEIMDGCYLLVHHISTSQAIAKATISSIDGKGSLINPCVVLDSHEIKKMTGARYNIGIGQFPDMGNNSIRENHIAIDDNPNSPEFEKNRYASRAHAYITYSYEMGFMLNVEFGGTKPAGKRTYISRGCEIINLESTLIPVPLQDGDVIILSKNIYLRFKQV